MEKHKLSLIASLINSEVIIIKSKNYYKLKAIYDIMRMSELIATVSVIDKEKNTLLSYGYGE